MNDIKMPNGDYYIHRHVQHFESDSAESFFLEQKKAGYEAAKQRYMNNFLQNVTPGSKGALKYLDLALTPQSDIVTTLDTVFLNTLNNHVSANIKSFNLENMMNKAFVSLKECVNTKEVKKIDDMFEMIVKASNLLNTDISALTALIGKNGYYKKYRDLKKLSAKIEAELKAMEKKTLNVSQSRLKSVLVSLNSLAKGLDTDASIQSLSKSLTNIFSTQIGEYIISKGVAKSLGLGLKSLRESLVGTSNVNIMESPETQALYQNFGQKGDQVFKTDNSFKNVSIEIKELDMVFNISLGLSAKWYNTSTSSVALTKEVSLTNRLNQMLKHDLDFYYAYNAISLAKQNDSAYSALKQALIARNIDVLISGLGVGGDFSQYIVINGNFYSIWEIIKQIEAINFGGGSVKHTDDIVTLHLEGASKIMDLTQERLFEPNNIQIAYKRSQMQNQLMQNVGFQAKLHLNKMKKIVS